MTDVSGLAALLQSAIGENAKEQGVTHYIDTGHPALNEIISGSPHKGLPQGRLVEIYGPSSSGKTAIATEMLINAQKMGGVAGFMDHERSFNVDFAAHMGLNTKFPFWIYQRPKTWEESNTMMAKAAKVIRESKAIPHDAPILFVFDSIAAAVPKSVLSKEMDEYTMNDSTALARVTSSTLKVVAQFAEEYNFTVLYLNQIRMKPGVTYGDPTTTPGGNAMEFFATARLAIARKKIMESEGGGKEFVGQEVVVKTTKSKLTRPNQETSLKMMFTDAGMGYFDATSSLIEYLVSKGKLTASGPRITYNDKSYFKKALIQHINDNNLYGELLKLI